MRQIEKVSQYDFFTIFWRTARPFFAFRHFDCIISHAILFSSDNQSYQRQFQFDRPERTRQDEDRSTGEISIECKNTRQIMPYGKVDCHLNNTGFQIVVGFVLFIILVNMHQTLMNIKG